MKHRFSHYVGVFCIALAPCLGLHAWAQTEEIETSFKKMDAAEEQKLRELLLTPVPQGAAQDVLIRHFAEKDRATMRLSDTAARIALMREAVKLLPNMLAFKNKLARELLSAGQINEGNALMRQVLEAADPIQGAFYAASVACDLVDQYKYTLARTALDDVAVRIKTAEPKATSDASRGRLARAQGWAAACTSALERRLGKDALAITAAESAEAHFRKAAPLLANTPDKSSVAADVAISIAGRLQAYRLGGRLQDAKKISETTFVTLAK